MFMNDWSKQKLIYYFQNIFSRMRIEEKSSFWHVNQFSLTES